MKGMFQRVVTVFVSVSFLLLAGCPKKITPTSKTVRGTRPPSSTKLPGIPDTPHDGKEEEESPIITRLEESDVPLSKKIDQRGKASALKDIYFDLDQWVLRPDDLPIIEDDANWIIAHPTETIRIEGHGDSRGTNEYNLVLGDKRSNAVKKAMVAMGVESTRLTVISYGEERPFCMTEDDPCFQENRRAHVRVE